MNPTTIRLSDEAQHHLQVLCDHNKESQSDLFRRLLAREWRERGQEALAEREAMAQWRREWDALRRQEATAAELREEGNDG